MPAGVVHACTDVTGSALSGMPRKWRWRATWPWWWKLLMCHWFEGVLPLVAQNRSEGLPPIASILGK